MDTTKSTSLTRMFALVLAVVALCASLTLVGCGGSDTTADSGGDAGSAAATATADEDEGADEEEAAASDAFVGTWEYAATIEQESVYGVVTTDVVAFDLELAEDGTATLTTTGDVEGYTDDSGTWEATSDTEATISLGSAGEFTATIDGSNLSIPAGTFSADDAEDYSLYAA